MEDERQENIQFNTAKSLNISRIVFAIHHGLMIILHNVNCSFRLYLAFKVCHQRCIINTKWFYNISSTLDSMSLYWLTFSFYIFLVKGTSLLVNWFCYIYEPNITILKEKQFTNYLSVCTLQSHFGVRKLNEWKHLFLIIDCNLLSGSGKQIIYIYSRIGCDIK